LLALLSLQFLLSPSFALSQRVFFFFNFSAVDQVSKFFLLPRSSLFCNLSLCSQWSPVALRQYSCDSRVDFFFCLFSVASIAAPWPALRRALHTPLSPIFDISIFAFSLVKNVIVKVPVFPSSGKTGNVPNPLCRTSCMKLDNWQCSFRCISEQDSL
jgi:hypothetical protein